MVFRLDTNILQLSERKLTNRLMEIHRNQMQGRITADEARRLGRIAIKEAFREDVELFNRSARAQGFKEAPIKLLDEEQQKQAIEKWDGIVDDTAKLREASDMPRPPR